MHDGQRAIDDALRLAQDLCLGIAAFFVTPEGTVRSTLSEVMTPHDGEARVADLARSCLAHPTARGRSLFWNAEAVDEAEASDCTLACVVAPVWSGDRWRGLLGVADVWLPDLDDEQRAGLLALARSVASQIDAAEGAEPAPAAAPVAPQEASGAPVAEPFLGEVLDNLPHGLVVTRSDGAIVLVNQTFATLSGLAMDDLLGEDVTAVFSLERRGGTGGAGTGASPADWMSWMLGEAGPDQELRVHLGSGDTLAVLASGRRIRSRFAGDCVVTLVQPARRSGEADAVAPTPAGASIEDLLESVDEGIVCCDAVGTVVLANGAARVMHGLPPDLPMVGLPFPAATGLQTPDGAPLPVDAHPLLLALHGGVPVAARFVRVEDGDRSVHVAVNARPLRPGGPGGAIAVLRDVSAEHEKQESLEYIALHDPLTGVANRYLLLEELRRMLDGLARRGGFVSLIYLDLDNFKEVNDVHGHEVGDEVLRAITRRLLRAVRGEDVVARIGGDELVVAHVTADRLSDADTVVARVRKVLSAPYRFGGLVMDVGASVGWVSTSTGEESAEALIAEADRAMYEEKRRRAARGREAVG